MDDPTSTDLVPVVPREDDPQPSSTVRDELKRAAVREGIDRPTLLSQIGHGVPMSPQQKAKLLRQATDDIVSLLPTGEVYVEGKYWRDVMNDTFGPMQWGLLSISNSIYEPAPPGAPKGVKSMLYLEVFLIVKGRCVACALGAQEYFPESKRMTKDDALEGCRTNGLMRCLKNFGTYSNLWEGRWADACRERIGVRVKVSSGWPTEQWRRLDDLPLILEVGLAQGSPNVELYRERFPQFTRHSDRGERPAPQQQREVRQPEPPPPQDVVQANSRDTSGPEKILVVRPTRYMNTATDPPTPGTMWVVNTDQTEYVTNDEDLHRSLEHARQNGKRIIVTCETVRGKHGDRKRIIEYRTVD